MKKMVAILIFALMLFTSLVVSGASVTAASPVQIFVADQNHPLVQQILAAPVFQQLRGRLKLDPEFRIVRAQEGLFVVSFEVYPLGAGTTYFSFYMQLASFGIHDGAVIMAVVNRSVVGENYMFYQLDLFTGEETAIRTTVPLPDLPPLPAFPPAPPPRTLPDPVAPERGLGGGMFGQGADGHKLPGFRQ